ncbi:M48 family metallopeptidase [Polymorphobacter sp.]|uniref:M48 family metallopeptidase n=1 Tax=Polymorphobacter sp. TaxID=1909290 RepID=UPI003F72CFAC
MRLFARLPDSVEVGGRQLPLVATRYRAARGIRLKPCAITSSLKLSLPARGGVREALDLIERHRGWLEAQVARWPAPLPFAPGAEIPFDGRTLLIDWDAARPLRPVLDGDRLRLGGPLVGVRDRTRRFLLAQARAALVPATQEEAAKLDRKVARIALNDPVGRWGSCNQRQGSINYSWRLILMPAWVRRAIVVHEVAHLVHANHGPDFWRLVAEMDGRAGESRRWLARFGREMHAVGAETGRI